MSESYLMAMPILIYNLGGEMIYILCSRLKAQKIAENKSSQVIHDVVANLFLEKFHQEILKHNIISKHQQVRKIFENLAHSSIMRLNATSMSKLFELMLMSFKLELVRSRYPEEIYQITLNHLESIKEIIIKEDASKNKENLKTVNDVITNFKNIYGKFSIYDYIILKSTLLRFLQGKNVKVSIFIQDKLQSQSNILFLPMNEIAPPLVGKPGEITIYDENGKSSDDYFELKLTRFYKKNNNNERNKNFCTDLGLNMFSDKKPRIIPRDESNTLKEQKVNDLSKEFNLDKKEDIKEKAKDEKSEDKKIKYENKNEKKEEEIDNRNNMKSSELFSFNNSQLPDDLKKRLSQNTKKEFNDLADLLIVPSNDNGTFKIDLFATNKKRNYDCLIDSDDDYIEIPREENIIKKFDNAFTGLINNDNDNNEDDLLDLMDMASKE